MKNHLGFILFVIGISIGVIGGAKAPQDGSTWSDALPIFATGFIMALIGLIVWKMSIAQQNLEKRSVLNTSKSNNDLNISSPLDYLYTLAVPFSQLVGQKETLSLQELHAEVTRLLENHMLPFAEERDSILLQLGMERGANLLITTSYCERMLYRVCSAASDGHTPEAHSSLLEAKEAFNELMDLI